MTTLTTRLGLKRWTTGNPFRVQDLTDNWNAIDLAPGTHICTSSTRPTTWNANQIGRRILETDTGLEWRYVGPASNDFVRVAPVGLLGRTAVTADVSTTSTTLVTAVTQVVEVPAGGRSLEIIVSGPGVYSTVNLTRLAVFRGATSLQSWLQHGKLTATPDAQPSALRLTLIDQAPTAGAQTYTLQYSAEIGYAGTSTLQAAVGNPLALSVVEV